MNLKLLFASFIIFCVFLTDNSLCHGDVYLSFKGEYNLLTLQDLEDLLEDYRRSYRNLGIPMSTVESFPPHYGIQFRFGLPVLSPYINNTDLGLLFDYSSTGGRISYKDYSGEIKVDQIIKMYSFGAYAEKKYDLYRNIRYVPGISGQFINSNLIINSMMRINNTTIKNSVEYSALAFGIEPYIEVRFEMSFVSFGVSAAYIVNLPLDNFKDDLDQIPLLSGHKYDKEFWMYGFRFGLTAGVSL